MTIESRTRILFVITKSNFGGAQRYVYDLATFLPKHKYHITVAFGGNGVLKQKLKEAGIETREIESLERDVRLMGELRALHSLAKIIKETQPDILHLNSSKAGITGSILGRILDVPKIIFTAHAWAFNEDRPTLIKIGIKIVHWLTVLLSHKTIAVSKAIKNQMDLPFAQDRMVVVRNGRSPIPFLDHTSARQELISHIPKLAPFANDTWTISIGELHPVKQHEMTIEALSLRDKHAKPIRHIIIGDGELKEKLEALVSKHKLEEHVFLAGNIPEAARLIPASDAFIIPSRSEALSYVAIEASKAGVPIIATNVGGIPEIVEHEKTGLLIEEGDPQALLTTLERLLADIELSERLANEAKKKGRIFTLEAMLEETENVYASLQRS